MSNLLSEHKPPPRRRPPRLIGLLSGDLDALGLLIKCAIVDSHGDEFVVWANTEGQVFIAVDTTSEARHVLASRQNWVINNYRSRWDIGGVRTYLLPSMISEDLAYHRAQLAVSA